ncbi:MAG: hypothetical protein VW942_02045, partial [Aquiluna sp.]
QEESAELIVPRLPGVESQPEESEVATEIPQADPPVNPLTYLLLPIALLLVVLIINSLRRGNKAKARTTKEGS